MNKKVKKVLIISGISLASIALAVGAGFGIRYIACQLERNSVGYIPNDEQLNHSPKYERVVIFGIDGAGSHFSDCDAPYFDKIFLDGSINYKALTQFEADSAPNWTSMLHGVKFAKHKVHNEDSGLRPYPNAKYPSIYKIAHEKYSDLKGLSISNWPNINTGIIEDLDYVTKISTGNDDRVVEEFKNNFLVVEPKITFVCLNDVDTAGHAHGLSEEYYAALRKNDARMGEMYDFLFANNKVDGTLFICVADHGHKKSGGHGFTFPIENQDIVRTTLAVNGNLGNIEKNGKMGKAVTQDVASIALYALGVKQPNNFDGRVPYSMFSDLK